MPHNRGTRHKPKYVGMASYKGHAKWVGTHSTLAAYKAAEWQRLAELHARSSMARVDCGHRP